MIRLAIILILLLAPAVYGQILTTAVTVGKGNQVLTISGNRVIDGDDHINVFYGMYTRGLTPRFDLYVGVGETSISGKSQAWVGVGENIKLFSMGKSSLSFFTIASVPLNRFKEACTVLLNPAVVVSRPLTKRLTIYSGVNSFIPVGAKRRGPFTPNEAKFNVPLGASIEFSGWSLAVESDLGRIKAIGIGISRSF
jgi:hypothetical protein